MPSPLLALYGHVVERISGQARLEALRSHLPRDLIAPLPRAPRRPVAKIIIVGAGFGGLATAYFLAACGFEVVVLEAQGHVGGRVSTDEDFIAGRLIEAGAELIGFNHAVWIGLADVFGLGFTMCTDDDAYAQLGLSSPVFLGGQLLTPDEADDVFGRMDAAFETLNVMAKDVDAYRPWKTPDAKMLDARSITDWMASLALPPLVNAAIETVLGNDNVMPTKDQSLLGFLAQIRGGGGSRFWTDTEVMKCANGNQSLAIHLAASINGYAHGSVRLETPVRRIDISHEAVSVTLGDSTEHADFVVLAVPPPTWTGIEVSPRIPGEYLIGTGPGVKFLSAVGGRFWLKDGKAPTALDEVIGETWEGTDNQAATPGAAFDLSVFAGGASAERALGQKNPAVWYGRRLQKLFPGYAKNVDATRFVDWPDNQWIRCGYSSPRPGEVTSVAPLLAKPFATRLVFAGEHVNPCFFGYMEGALQSGLLALGHIAEASDLFRHDKIVDALDAAVQVGWEETSPSSLSVRRPGAHATGRRRPSS